MNGIIVSIIKDEQGQPWWIAKEVCKILELMNPSMVLKSLDDDELAKFNLGRQGKAWIINEPGLYSLIFRSKKLIAKIFKRWVGEVIRPFSCKSHF